jgi:hypothetical protein
MSPRMGVEKVSLDAGHVQEVLKMVNPSSPAPGEARHPVTVTGTLMPHSAAGRHHLYRNLTALALLASLLAAAFGSLSIALVLAAVALPAIVLTYIHDHNLWHDEPLTVIVVTFALSLVLGVGVGFLQTRVLGIALAAGHDRLPRMSSILELGVLVPVVAFVAVLVAPLLVTARAKFRHPMDVVVTCALSGAALSLGLSVVVQHGAFTHLQATAGYPASVAFIALTLGFLQPVIFATAAAVSVLGLRCAGLNPAIGVVEGLVLVVLYELATTLLVPYGSHGIALTTFVSFLLAGAGLWATRTALHTAVDVAPDVGPVEHRLHGTVVAAIIGVVVALAAGITAAVVFSGSSTEPKPPSTGAGVAPTPHAAGGQTINLPDGVTLTAAPGWTVVDSSQTWVLLANSDNSALMEVESGKSSMRDITQEAGFMAGLYATDRLTNVIEEPQAVQPVQGKNFTQSLQVNYTANRQTDQGTMQLYGIWTTLFNASTQIAGFIDFSAISPDAFQAALPDAKSMLASML